jgi:hypothetical protein
VSDGTLIAGIEAGGTKMVLGLGTPEGVIPGSSARLYFRNMYHSKRRPPRLTGSGV